MVEPLSLNSRVFTVKLVGVRKFRNFTVSPNTHLLCTNIVCHFFDSVIPLEVHCSVNMSEGFVIAAVDTLT